MRLTVSFALFLAVSASNAAAQSPPPPEPVPPSPTAFANLQLPTWVRLGIEHRGRLEGPMGTGFAADREDLYWLNRFRVTARFSIKPWLSATVQAQDARVEGRNGPVAGAPFRDQFDLRLAHADVGSLERSRLAIRIGQTGAGIRRSAPRRPCELAQYRAVVRRGAGRLPAQETARRRLCGIGRHHAG